tara:strand:- start:3614 stop:4606 length:993 start_codon:yes stop_codon:yes gene_type:complete
MTDKHTKISLYEKILGHFEYWKDFLDMTRSVKKTFDEPNLVLWNVFNNKLPLKTKLRNGKSIEIQSFNALYFVSKAYKSGNITFDDDKDIVKIGFKDKKSELIFHGGMNNGDLANIFVKNDYEFLKVENKIVLDIGANIGDTAIYFATKGARKVIGIEPFHENFKIAQKNIAFNNFLNEIELVQAGCSSESGKIKISTEDQSNIESVIKESETGEDISLVSLKDIIEKYKIPKDSILKIDCEGCEYDIIENAEDETLLHFSQIQLEYHSGYKSLKRKFESIGYEVKFTQPHATDVINTFFSNFRKTSSNSINGKSSHKIGYVGFLMARKK